jgi:hypothetical protein
VIVKEFQVVRRLRGAAQGQMQGRGAVRGERHPIGLAQGGSLQKAGDAAASGVGLQHVDRLVVQHPVQVVEGKAVFSRADLHPRRDPLPQPAQPLKVTVRHRFLEPCHTLLSESRGQPECLLQGIAAVGVHEQFGGRSDRLARPEDPQRISRGIPTHLHLDPPDPLPHPILQLTLQLLNRVRGEAAAAVNRNGVARGTEQVDQWQA